MMSQISQMSQMSQSMKHAQARLEKYIVDAPVALNERKPFAIELTLEWETALREQWPLITSPFFDAEIHSHTKCVRL